MTELPDRMTREEECEGAGKRSLGASRPVRAENRPRRSVWVEKSRLVGLVLGMVFGCSGAPLGHPNIEVEVTGIGDEGGRLKFRVDAKGRFQIESEGDIGNGTIASKRCHGTLPAEKVAPVFAEFDAARLGGREQAFPAKQNSRPGRAPSRERTTIRYARDAGDVDYPVDQMEFERLDPLLDDLRANARRSEPSCVEGRR